MFYGAGGTIGEGGGVNRDHSGREKRRGPHSFHAKKKSRKNTMAHGGERKRKRKGMLGVSISLRKGRRVGARAVRHGVAMGKGREALSDSGRIGGERVLGEA